MASPIKILFHTFSKLKGMFLMYSLFLSILLTFSSWCPWLVTQSTIITKVHKTKRLATCKNNLKLTPGGWQRDLDVHVQAMLSWPLIWGSISLILDSTEIMGDSAYQHCVRFNERVERVALICASFKKQNSWLWWHMWSLGDISGKW